MNQIDWKFTVVDGCIDMEGTCDNRVLSIAVSGWDTFYVCQWGADLIKDTDESI